MKKVWKKRYQGDCNRIMALDKRHQYTTVILQSPNRFTLDELGIVLMIIFCMAATFWQTSFRLLYLLFALAVLMNLLARFRGRHTSPTLVLDEQGIGWRPGRREPLPWLDISNVDISLKNRQLNGNQAIAELKLRGRSWGQRLRIDLLTIERGGKVLLATLEKALPDYYSQEAREYHRGAKHWSSGMIADVFIISPDALMVEWPRRVKHRIQWKDLVRIEYIPSFLGSENGSYLFIEHATGVLRINRLDNGLHIFLYLLRNRSDTRGKVETRLFKDDQIKLETTVLQLERELNPFMKHIGWTVVGIVGLLMNILIVTIVYNGPGWVHCMPHLVFSTLLIVVGVPRLVDTQRRRLRLKEEIESLRKVLAY